MKMITGARALNSYNIQKNLKINWKRMTIELASLNLTITCRKLASENVSLHYLLYRSNSFGLNVLTCHQYVS